MREGGSILRLVLMCVLAAPAAPCLAQDAAKADDKAKAEMEAMVRAGTPGEQHRMLGEMAGTWKVTMRAWMAPGQPAMESSATSEVTSLLGGRYTQERFAGTFMGAPFEGTGLSGYDNVTKKYVGTWADNMSTGVMMMTGDYDAASKTYNMVGSYNDPVTGGVKSMRLSTQVVDANKHVESFFDMLPGGKEVKIMELTYVRAK